MLVLSLSNPEFSGEELVLHLVKGPVVTAVKLDHVKTGLLGAMLSEAGTHLPF